MCHPMTLALLAIILTVYFCSVDHSSASKGGEPDGVSTSNTQQRATVAWSSIVGPGGDRFPDFSYSGYHSSEQSLPVVGSATANVSLPSSASRDMRPAIQQAIDAVAQAGGGVVMLPKGKLAITAGIVLPSNVVVTGSAGGGTVLTLKRKPSEPVFTLGSGDDGNATYATLGFSSNITDKFVPIGSSTLHVLDGTGFVVGQSVYISRSVRASWVRVNGMSDLFRYGRRQVWIPVNKTITSPNTIKAINGTKITFVIPMTDSLDARYMNPQLTAYTPPALSSEMGIQNLRIEVPKSCSGVSLSAALCNAAAVEFSPWTVDSWVSGLELEGFNSFFMVRENTARITIQNTTMNRTRDVTGVALPVDILLKGSQTLVQDCSQIGLATARCFSVVTDSLTPGPNAVLRHATNSNVQTISPHERWAHGLLVESTSVVTKFENRGIKGTGHGWAINAGVGWNIDGEADFESPPLGVNWCVGCGGKVGTTGNATFVRSGQLVNPPSLFQEQLRDRGFA